MASKTLFMTSGFQISLAISSSRYFAFFPIPDSDDDDQS